MLRTGGLGKLSLLSRSHPGPSTSAAQIDSQIIRLSALRAEHGSTAAILRVARSSPGAAELQAQRRVLAELLSHPDLEEEWCELVPRTLAFDERIDATVSVESYRPGIDMREALASRPDRVEELTAAALNAIAPLHRRTATYIVVDDAFRRWVVEPLAALTHMCRRLDPRLVPVLDRIESMLGRALVGRRMPVSWTHGDYTPANIRLAGVKDTVTGIVGWSRARSDRLPLIDEYLLVLTASCHVEQADLGTVVTERLQSGGLSARERHVLHAASDRSETDTSDSGLIDERIDERLAILLTWLHHVADLWCKRATSADDHVWWVTDVAPVLDTIGARRGFDLSDAG
jgi:hypothetical protein